MTRPTAADRAYWAAHPLTVDATKKLTTTTVGSWPDGAETDRPHVTGQLAVFNVVSPA